MKLLLLRYKCFFKTKDNEQDDIDQNKVIPDMFCLIDISNFNIVKITKFSTKIEKSNVKLLYCLE